MSETPRIILLSIVGAFASMAVLNLAAGAVGSGNFFGIGAIGKVVLFVAFAAISALLLNMRSRKQQYVAPRRIGQSHDRQPQ